MPVEDHLTPEQARAAFAVLASADPDLARAVSLQLASDPVATEISRMRVEVGGEIRSFGEGMREEMRTTTRNAFLLVGLGLVLSAAISAGVAGLTQYVSVGRGGLTVETLPANNDAAGSLDDSGVFEPFAPTQVPTP